MNVTYGVRICASILVIILSGCATPRYSWRSEPIERKISNDYVDVSISPLCGHKGCEAFQVTVINKTGNNVEVDWNKTLYIRGGQTYGGFMFDGVVYADRNNPKVPDVVFPRGVMTKIVWPNNLVDYKGGKYGLGWIHEPMPSGDNGVFLSFINNGKEAAEKLTVNLMASQIER